MCVNPRVIQELMYGSLTGAFFALRPISDILYLILLCSDPVCFCVSLAALIRRKKIKQVVVSSKLSSFLQLHFCWDPLL